MIKNIKTVSLVFSNWRYFSLAIIFMFLFFCFIIVLPSYGLVAFIIKNQGIDALMSGNILFVSWDFFKLNSTFFSRTIAIVISVLSGINLAMFVFYIKRRIKLYKSSGLGFLAALVGLLGIGCASCGSVLITSIFGFGATAFLGFLPFHGLEIGFLGIAFLLLSIYLLADKISNPLVCASKKK